VRASYEQAESLRRSILKRAFEGRLVPQDPNDEPASVLLERIKKEKAKQEPARKRSMKLKTTTQRRLTINGD
jgi:type I restriction enzyme S subunit